MRLDDVSPRLTAWIACNFEAGTAEEILDVLRDLPPGAIGGQDPERIQAALVLGAGGSWQLFLSNVELAKLDYRDALVGGGLGNADWPCRLTDVLGG